MKEFQKIIKYAAIAFGLYLAIMIIGMIVTGILAICTGIYGVQVITEQTNVEKIDETEEFSDIFKIDIDVTNVNLTIKSEGEKFFVETYQIPVDTKIENNQGILKIKDNQKIVYNSDSTIIIYIPENTELQECDIEIGAGKLDIEKLHSKKVDFNFGAGRVNINELITEKAEIECGAGEVSIKTSDLTNSKIETGMGKLIYSGYLRGNSQLECGIGETEINLQGGEELYKIKTEKGIGNIKINNETITSGTTTGNGENSITVEGGIGKININM